MIGLKKYAMGGISTIAKGTYETDEEYDEAFGEIQRMLASCRSIEKTTEKFIKEKQKEK
jgi:hypothetical protein